MIQAIRLCWRKWARTKKYRQPLLASGFDLREAKRKCWVEHESNLSDCVFAGFERSPCSWRPRDADQPVLHPVGREANRGAVSEAEHFDDRGARGDTQPLRREVLRNRQIGVLIRATRKKIKLSFRRFSELDQSWIRKKCQNKNVVRQNFDVFDQSHV